MTKSETHPSIIDMPSKEQLDHATRPYSDEELELSPDVQAKLEKLLEFFENSPINYDKFDLDKKKAYPNNDQYMYIPGQHNTNKWLNAVREIYVKEKNGFNRVAAIRHITSGWNVTETYDFLNWLKFHESGDHMKYKFAQLWYENGAPGYFLHVKPDAPKEPEPSVSGKDIDFARDSVANEMTNSEKKQIIEKQRNKIIGRLDSAEKLLRSPDGQIFSGKEFESLMESIYQLKKKVQMVNKISTSTRLYEDMIVREANILQRQGFTKAAHMLHSIAQTPAANGQQGQGKDKGGIIPEVISPAPPGQGSGAAGGLPSMGPGMPQPPGSPPSPSNANQPAPNKIEAPKPKGISDFLEGMETSKLTTNDEHGIDDELEVEDTLNIDDDLLVIEAQSAPPMDIPMTDSPAPAKLDPSPVKAPILKKPESSKLSEDEEPLEVIEPEPGEASPIASDFDAKVDALFSNVTIADVVQELENLSKVFKTREVPRRLSKADMLLDSLGLASYFPSLAEAQNKALESNNYIATRVDDILSKLRGALATKEIDLEGRNEEDKPEVSGIKSKLKSDDEKEKARKQLRKDQEISEMSNKTKETPEIEIEEDLAPPPPAPVLRAPVKAPSLTTLPPAK